MSGMLGVSEASDESLRLPTSNSAECHLFFSFSFSYISHPIFTFLLLLIGRSWHVGLVPLLFHSHMDSVTTNDCLPFVFPAFSHVLTWSHTGPCGDPARIIPQKVLALRFENALHWRLWERGQVRICWFWLACSCKLFIGFYRYRRGCTDPSVGQRASAALVVSLKFATVWRFWSTSGKRRWSGGKEVIDTEEQCGGCKSVYQTQATVAMEQQQQIRLQIIIPAAAGTCFGTRNNAICLYASGAHIRTSKRIWKYFQIKDLPHRGF